MKEKDLSEAKRLYFAYACNIFFMVHNGDGSYERYKRFRVPSTLESLWLEEYQEGLFKKYQQETGLIQKKISLLEILSNVGPDRKSEFLKVMEIIKKDFSTYDFFSQLGLIWGILDCAKRFDQNTIQFVVKETYPILKQMLENPLRISEEYTEDEEWDQSYTTSTLYDQIERTLRGVGGGYYFTE